MIFLLLVGTVWSINTHMGGQTHQEKLRTRVEGKRATTGMQPRIFYPSNQNRTHPAAGNAASPFASVPLEYSPCGHLANDLKHCYEQKKLCRITSLSLYHCLVRNKLLDDCDKGCFQQRGWGRIGIDYPLRGSKLDYDCFRACLNPSEQKTLDDY